MAITPDDLLLLTNDTERDYRDSALDSFTLYAYKKVSPPTLVLAKLITHHYYLLKNSMVRPGAKSSKKARSFSGCKCCKQAKRKCPEERPRCSICEKLGLKCEVPSILSVFQLILTWSSMISTFYSDVKWSISKVIFQKPKGSLDLVSLNPLLCIWNMLLIDL